MTNTSIGELFVAGFIPGIVYGVVFMLYSFYYAVKHKIPVQPKATGRQVWNAFKEAGWALGIPAVILGGVYGGFCTPTESAGIAAVYSILVSCFVYKELEALDKACFVLAGIDEKSLLQAVDTAIQMNLDGNYGIPVPDYVEENVSTKVVKLIQSYTGVVNKMVWRKY